MPLLNELKTLDERLDEALWESFPASDPVAIHIEKSPAKSESKASPPDDE